MPVFSRRSLRQRLGTEILHDTITGTTSGSWGTQAGSYNIVDSTKADPTMSGEQIYYRHHLRLLGSAGFIQDMRVGSFNTGSGAFVGAQTLATTIFSGMPYEVHRLISPTDKDKAIDAVISGIRNREKRDLWTIENMTVYSLGPEYLDIVGVSYYADPLGSLNQDEMPVIWHRFEQVTGAQPLATVVYTGLPLVSKLHIGVALPASYHLVMDAITSISLGAGDLATVNLQSDDLVIWGAAARCYWMAGRGEPAQETAEFDRQRKEAAREYTRLSQIYKPKITRKVQLDTLY